MCEALGQPQSLLSVTSETTGHRISHPITHPVPQNVSVTPAALLGKGLQPDPNTDIRDRESNTLPGICLPVSKHFLSCRAELCFQHVWLQDPAIGKSGTFFSPQLKDAFYNLVFSSPEGDLLTITELSQALPIPASLEIPFPEMSDQGAARAWLDLSNSYQRRAKNTHIVPLLLPELGL